MFVTSKNWLEAVLLMINSFGGFEAALFVSGETRDPRKDAPIALLVALTTATFLYVSVQYVVIHTLPTATTARLASPLPWESKGTSRLFSRLFTHVFALPMSRS